MLDIPDLATAITACGEETLRATVYRATRLQYLSTLTSPEGAWSAPNRYTAPNVSRALYLADGPDQAMLEATRQFQAAFSTSEVPAYGIYPVRVNLRRVLDLTYLPNLSTLGTSIEELTGNWRAAYETKLKDPHARVVSQDLGRAALS